MNEGVLIIYLGKWMPFWRSLGLALRGRVRWGELSVLWSVGAFLADSKVDSYFWFWDGFGRLLGGLREDSGRDWGGFWEGLGTYGLQVDSYFTGIAIW